MRISQSSHRIISSVQVSRSRA